MRAAVSSFTAALLIVHAMIGCCHHHWHQVDECAAAARSAPCCACCCPRVATPGESQAPTEPCNGERECQGVCTYLPTSRLQLDIATDHLGWDVAAMTSTLTHSTCDDTAALWTHWQIRDDSPPPLRLHLLHQILLI
jgi:hypothetical protein